MAQHSYSFRSFPVSPEEEAIITNIVPKHAPAGKNVEVSPIMRVIEDVFLNSIFKSSMVSQEIRNSIKARNDPPRGIELNDNTRYTIHRLSWEITCMCFKGFDEPTITKNIFNLLATFNWEENAVLVLAALAMSYGEFWFTISPMSENPLSLSLSTFRQLPCLRGSSLALKSRFEAQANLIKSMLDLANCLIELKDYFPQLQSIFPIKVACHRLVRSVALCLFHNMELAKMGTEYTGSDSEIPKLNDCTQELQSIYAFLNEELEIEKEKEIFSANYKDISIKVEKFFATTEKFVLRCGSIGGGAITTEVRLDALQGRLVAFFISDFNFNVHMQEFKILVDTYKKIKGGKHRDEFEIVWIPMVDQSVGDPNPKMKCIAHDRAIRMPWLSFYCPRTIKTSFRSYIRESWHFQKKPILVVMDSKGTVTCTNAIPMVTIWGASAYPFTSSMEADLWKKGDGWNVENLVEQIDPQITTVIKQGKLVCLYGGDDWDSIKNFVQTMKKVMEEAAVPMDLIYIGINGRGKKLQKIIATFQNERTSKYWTEEMICSFWFRLQSMYNSRMQCGTLVQDNRMQNLTKISTFGSGDCGWAMMMFKEPLHTVVASEKQMMGFLERYKIWIPKLHIPTDILSVAEDDMTNNHS